MELIWNWVLYISAFLLIVAVVAVLYVVVVEFVILTPISGHKKIDDRSGWIQFIVLVTWIIVSIGSPYLILNGLNYRPPLSQELVSVAEKNSDDKILQLSNEITAINETLANLDDLTLNEIRAILGNLSSLLTEIKNETVNQRQAIISLKSQTEREREKANEAIEYANQIESLTQEQIEAVSVLILSDANAENQKSFWIGVLVSLPIGIIGSLFSAFLWNKMRSNSQA